MACEDCLLPVLCQITTALGFADGGLPMSLVITLHGSACSRSIAYLVLYKTRFVVSSCAVERRHSVDVQMVAFEVLQHARDCLRAT